MSKCGKGCMPECEYFTTGGCISPFSCPYKIEMGYINSATSTTDSLTGLLMEFDEMGLLRQRRAPDPEKYAIEGREKVRKEIERLKSENAALRERLEKAVELPRIEQSPYNGMFNGQTINDDTLLYYIEDGHIKQECFNNKFPEQLQKRLAELKGGKE